jgi:hypothetical protein
VRARTISSLSDDGATVLTATSDRLGLLEPDAVHGPIHQIVIDYFASSLDTWMSLVAPATALDPTAYDVVTERIESERVAARRRLVAAYPPLLSAQPDSKIAAAVESWFREPDDADATK